MVDGTQNFDDCSLNYMQNHPNEDANKVGSRVPYHLQYLRDGKVNVKPEVKDGQSVSDE